MFAEALKRWVSGVHDADYAETWSAFCGRVEAGASRLRDKLRRGETALVFTSGGPISAIVRALLGLCDERAAQLDVGKRCCH